MPLMQPENWEHNQKERLEHWARIRKARNAFEGTATEFFQFLENDYGIQLTLNEYGQITQDYSVLDDQKYFIFMLKYV